MKIGTVVAALTGGIVMFVLGGIAFGILFTDYFRANMIAHVGLLKDPPLMWAVFLFNLAWAVLITFVLNYANRTGWAEGAKTGAITMFLIALGIDLEYHAFMHIHKDFAPMILHVLIMTSMGLVSGAVIGTIRSALDR